jgi:beta-1,2-mannobiose phosphorylase / 1,2-beta-oligomannan phosphorylase
MFRRHPENPIIVPGQYPWRMAAAFNPGVIYEDGRFFLYERAASGLRPFHCFIGLLESADGVHFQHVSDQPVFTPEMAGSAYGSVQDPRVVKIEATYFMTYAYRPFTWSINPTGVGVFDGYQTAFPGFDGDPSKNQTRTGIAVSEDRIKWRHLSWVNDPEVDDRDILLFPEKIHDQYVVLRRPRAFVGAMQGQNDRAGIAVSYSHDLVTWTQPEPVIEPQFEWEGNRIGGSTPPIRTRQGWLVFYHGVETVDRSIRRVCYRMGAMLLDLEDPRRVLARTAHFLMEPEMYYEKFGSIIPNVIFPTGAVLVDGLLYLYYGVCDTAIALATAPLDEVLARIQQDS